jgi:hypothetical protein
MVKKASIKTTLQQTSKFTEVQTAQILSAYINKDIKTLQTFFPNVKTQNLMGSARRIANGIRLISNPTKQTQQILTQQWSIPDKATPEQIFEVWKKGQTPKVKLNKKVIQRNWVYRNLGNSTDEIDILNAIENILANELRGVRKALASLCCVNEYNTEYSIGTTYLIANPWDIYNDLLFKIPLTGRTGKSWDYGEAQYFKSVSMLAE